MAKLKLADNVLQALEAHDALPFDKNQRRMVSALKSGQNHYLWGGEQGELRTSIVATLLHQLKSSYADVARALILVPNKEVAEEYGNWFDLLGKHTDLRVWLAYEGPNIQKQKDEIYFGTDVLVATPNRLNDLLNIEGFNSSSVQSLILDSADSLLKVGTNGFTKRISDSVPNKQRVAFTHESSAAVKNYMNNFAFPFISEPLEFA